MSKKVISLDELRAIILAEAAKDERCEGVDRVSFYQVEEENCANWTVSFIGGAPGSEAVEAMGAILRRMTAQYDVAWETRH